MLKEDLFIKFLKETIFKAFISMGYFANESFK